MRKIVYYVATSLDGYIASPDLDISYFSGNESIEQYKQDLLHFDTVIMGRNTYEYGYRFGLQPGHLAYPHMKHYIFSNTLELAEKHEDLKILDMDIEHIHHLKNQEGTAIYLCGGGQLAGWLLEHNMIDVLKIKLNPMILGEGIRLFGPSTKNVRFDLTESVRFPDGLHIITFSVQ